jgi:hypothetical protein
MPRNMHDSEQPHPGDESEVKQKETVETATGAFTENEQDFMNRHFADDFKDSNNRPLDQMFGRPGEEKMYLDSARLVDAKTLSLMPDKSPKEVQAYLTKTYEQQLDKVLAANEPSEDAKRTASLLDRGGSTLEKRWENKKKFFKELLSAKVEQQWARTENAELQKSQAPVKAYEAKILQQDQEKLQKISIEQASLNEKAAVAKEQPVEVTIYSPIGRPPEIRVAFASKEKADYGRQAQDLEHNIYELGRQVSDIKLESDGFFGGNKKKKEQRIAAIEQQISELAAQKLEAQKAEQQEKTNERAMKEVNAMVGKINSYQFSRDNLKIDKLQETKTLGQFVETLNAELQKLGNAQPTPEQSNAQRLVARTEQRLQNADRQIKELESIGRQRRYDDMKGDSVAREY